VAESSRKVFLGMLFGDNDSYLSADPEWTQPSGASRVSSRFAIWLPTRWASDARRSTAFHMVRKGTEEPWRGTLCTLKDQFYLFTGGYVPW